MADIEYFDSAQSAFAYLGSARFMTIAKAAGRRIAHRPIDLRRVVAEAGSVSFGKRSKAHIAYFFGREIERWSEARGAPTIPGIPTHHAKDPALANCMLIAGLGCGIGIDHLAHAMLEAHWRDDANLADRPTLAAIGRAVGIDPESLLDGACSPEVRQVLSGKYRGGDQSLRVRFADLCGRRRYVLRPGSTGDGRTGVGPTLSHEMVQF